MITVKEFLNSFDLHTSKNLINSPKISVILPTFCRGNNGLLTRAIDSVLNQTFSNLELIIVDDYSVDDTENIVKEYLKKDSRIVYIRNHTYSGLPAIRVNQGLLHARGKYVAYQFDDDLWMENALEVLYKEIIEQKKECMVYGIGIWRNVRTKEELKLGAPVKYHELLEYNRIINNSVLHSRSLSYDYGTYDCHITMRRSCDWDLWLRWIQKVPFVFVDKIVSIAEYNHENSIGIDCVFDEHLFRIYYSLNRWESLKLNKIHKFCIDNLDFLTDEAYKKSVYKKQILPWINQKNG